MKSNKKLMLLFLALGLVFIAVSIISNTSNNNNVNKDQIQENEILTPEESWFNNNENPIYIDASATGVGAQNWTWARSQDWCQKGDGSYGYPYIIENVTINAEGSEGGIYIVNSKNIYFKIQNCTVYNSGTDWPDAGIKLVNTNNGTIFNNTCSNNVYYGIYLENQCLNNTIANNTANNNSQHGIFLQTGCDNNTLSGNTANNNTEGGIYLMDYCDNNTISNNTANNNVGIYPVEIYKCGINLENYCDNNTISGNTANNNDKGINLEEYCDNNTISGNTANDNTQYGIKLGYSDGNTISGNTANNNYFKGIHLYRSNNNNITGNTANNNTEGGIYLYNGCDDNTISGNTANDNPQYGINLRYSDGNTISGNTANNNTEGGIYLYNGCDDNTISGNTANDNELGIHLIDDCADNTIENNTLFNNTEVGILLSGMTHDNLIYKNIFSGNTLHACDDGTNNFWDNGTVGNLWVDYDGVDANGDGIGDIYYNISGAANKKDFNPIYPIPRPLNMDLHQDIGYMYLSWDEPIQYVLPIIRYNIYRGKTEGGSKTYIGNSSTTEFYDVPPFNKTMYYYIVRTVNMLGESENSTEVSGMARVAPFVQWKTPGEEEVVVLPVGDAIFNFNYDCAEIDDITLEINGTDFGSIWNLNSIILSPYTVDIDGRVNATLWGYQTDIPVVNDTRTFIFTKLTSEVYELLDTGTKYLGQQLYLILHDPSGDGSFSSFLETTTISIGVGGEISYGVSGSLEIGAEFSLFGIGAGASFKVELKATQEEGYEYRYEITDITELTSNQDWYDKDYIGPGYGDRYWGEAWTLKWELKVYHRTYFNGSDLYEEPKLAYGIIRGGEVFLNDYNAPQAWRDLNPVHNGWQNVNWKDNLTIAGGSPYTKTHEVTETAKHTKSVEIEIGLEARTKLSYGGCYMEASIGFSTSSKNYREQEETNAYIISYTIYDDESTDTIVQEYGIDTLFGTYIFRTNEFMCETSYPLEHNTTDYIPPIIDFPTVELDSSHDGLYPCKDDSPIITIDIFDEGGIQSALLWFYDGANKNSVILSEQPANPGTWQASIPVHNHGTTVLWWIQVWDLRGLNSTRKDPNGNPYIYTVINRAPTLSLISPNGNETLKDSVLIEWSASDLDGDDLTFTLAYSDGGGGWYLIEENLTGNSYEWDISNIPYSDSILIKVVVYDGFGGQAEDQSDFLFTIGDPPKERSISEDDDDDDGDEIYEIDSVLIAASIVIAGGVIATTIVLHAFLMKKRFVAETSIPSKKKKPIKKLR